MSKNYKLKLSDILVVMIVVTLAAYLSLDNYNSQPDEDTNYHGQTIEGYATIADGDSIKIKNIKIRLIGIDAPELHQFCGPTQQKYACGIDAKSHLIKLIDNDIVSCFWQKRDKYNRLLADCKTSKISSLNAQMVRNGWAVSYYNYPEEQETAKSQKLGIWSSSFQWPQQWRNQNNR